MVKDLNLELSPELQLGDSFLRFEREILLEPESGAGMLRLAPRLLMNIDDLNQTGLVTAASRARFRLLVAGSKESLAAFGQAIEPILKPYQSWHVADLRRDEVRNTIGRVVSYLRVTVLLSVVLAIVAMALAAQGLWGRQIHEIALLRCPWPTSFANTQVPRPSLYARSHAGIVVGHWSRIFGATLCGGNYSRRDRYSITPTHMVADMVVTVDVCRCGGSGYDTDSACCQTGANHDIAAG